MSRLNLVKGKTDKRDLLSYLLASWQVEIDADICMIEDVKN